MENWSDSGLEWTEDNYICARGELEVFDI